MTIKKLVKQDRYKAIQLAVSVFMKYDAPDYSDEGIKPFKATISKEEYLSSLTIYGAYTKSSLVGIIAVRNEGHHIALFFVNGNYHRQGIGRQLFQQVLKNSTGNEITVNSSPYALNVYHKLGFIDIDAEQTADGIRYIPMVYRKNS